MNKGFLSSIQPKIETITKNSKPEYITRSEIDREIQDFDGNKCPVPVDRYTTYKKGCKTKNIIQTKHVQKQSCFYS